LIVIVDVYNSCLCSVVGDGLGNHNDLMFSTWDQDNDEAAFNCAMKFHFGAWWYGRCASSNLNGLYGAAGERSSRYMSWFTWKYEWEALKRTAMLIRAKS
jgi:hypothetical protein